MKVYKFRPLADCQSLQRIEQILTAGKFWCSRFWDLNDPMEGIYRLSPNGNPQDIQTLFQAKANRLICSFSSERALQSPLMWGYYANGFKGVAIEVAPKEGELMEVRYCANLFTPAAGGNEVESVRKLLCRKLVAWSHECEWRFLLEHGEHAQQIGEITGVVIGYPYNRGKKHPNVDQRWEKAQQYDCRVKRVIELAQARHIAVRSARISNRKIAIEPWNDLPQA